MIHLPGVLAAAESVQGFCQKRGWRFCFIGGVVIQFDIVVASFILSGS